MDHDTDDMDMFLAEELSSFTLPVDTSEQPQVAGDVPTAEETTPQQDNINKALEKLGISLSAVEQWKKQYGSVYIFPLSDNDVYLWRPIYKHEWDALNIQVSALRANTQVQPGQADPLAGKLEELILKRCVLWPKVSTDLLKKARAGWAATMLEVIMQGSYFISPQQALSLVTEL